jgi:GT2 family glycosyltransferase
MDEDLFWIEDADLCLRIHQVGWKVYFVPDIQIVHFGEASAKTNLRLKIRRQYFNKIGFIAKYGHKFELIILEIFLFIEVAIKLLIRLVEQPFSKGRFTQRIQGYMDVEAGILRGKINN